MYENVYELINNPPEFERRDFIKQGVSTYCICGSSYSGNPKSPVYTVKEVWNHLSC